MGYDSEVHSCDIGSFCSIANGFVVGGAKHPLDWVSTSPIFYNVRGGSGSHLGNLEIEPLKRSTIGHDVWIGNRVTVMQWVNVGIGAVIGAGSVVTKDIPLMQLLPVVLVRLLNIVLMKKPLNAC